MKHLFSKNGAGHRSATHLDGAVDQLLHMQNTGNLRVSQGVTRSALAVESIAPQDQSELEQSVKGLQTALETFGTTHLGGISQAQRDAGIAAAVLAGDVGAYLRAPVTHSVPSTESLRVIGFGAGDNFSERMRPALEAYDEKENRNAVVYSVAYNMQAARQDEFGEAFFPTVVVTPDQVGFAVNIQLVEVYNEVRRNISGELNNFGRRNIIQAVIDPTILRNDQTKIVPVYRDESKDRFVPSSLVTPYDVDLDGQPVTTAPLAMGKSLSLLGISQTDALLETGILDSTDAIDSSVVLNAMYLRVPGATPDDDEVFKFGVSRLPYSVFNYAPQGNYRAMQLNFDSKMLLIDKATPTVDGSASVLLKTAISDKKLAVRLGVKVSGSVNLELGDTNLFASEVVVVRVTTEDGVQLASTDPLFAAVVDVLKGATMIGYDLDAQRTNSNRRQRGQLLNTNMYTQLYSVPLRSPISIPRPLTAGDQTDASDLAALITTTHIRASNEAVGELIRVAGVLRDFVKNNDIVGDDPEILGVARRLLKPIYEYKDLDVASIIDSRTSHERAEDTQAVLVNVLRDMAYRMYRDSGYKAAADALAGGVAVTPTVIIGTDPVIARYLTITGDLRTLGNGFNVKLVTTLDKRMAGKIYMTFGVFGEGTEGVVHPLHFGNMAWKPELTLVLPLHRNGQTSKELTVQPSFTHITNLPILAELDISGIPDVVAAKVSVNFHAVP